MKLSGLYDLNNHYLTTQILYLKHQPKMSMNHESSKYVAFDAFSIIKEEVQNPTLWFQKNLAMPPKSR